MEKITFKEFLKESKGQLLQAISNVPTTLVEYEIRKYCSLPIGETEEEKVLIGLRPKNSVLIEWRYDNAISPTPVSIKFLGSKDIEDNEPCATFWSGGKLHQWLKKHANQGQNNGHKL